MTSVLPDPAAKAAAVEAMFDRIAPRYDLMNRLLTFGLDQRWRRAMLRRAGIGRGDVVVDLGCGTGDVCELAAAGGARAIGVDVAAGMLAVARRRGVPAEFVRADAARLPLRSGAVAVVTSAFALRNVVSIPALLAEAARVLQPGGRLALLEVDEPAGRLSRWGHALYFRRVVPLLGRILSDGPAYRYLPESAAYLPAEGALRGMLEEAGFERIAKHHLGGGGAQLVVSVRA